MADRSLLGTLLIRADAGVTIGIGHVMRCLALSQAWSDEGGQVAFVSHDPMPAIIGRLAAESVSLHRLEAPPGTDDDAAETIRFAQEVDAKWMVVDGYHFSAAYRQLLRSDGRPLLTIDDLGQAAPDGSDVLLNQNIYAAPELYACHAPARLLLGTRYALLRREFARAAVVRRVPAPVRHVLLTFGGSDESNATERMIAQLIAASPYRLHITVVVGATNPHAASLRAAALRARVAHDVELLFDPPDLPTRLAAADLVISAAGSTTWELAALGVPMALIVTAENQRRIADAFDAAGAALSLGDVSTAFGPDSLARLFQAMTSPAKLATLAATARRWVDGRGARRVVERLSAHPLMLRYVSAADARLIWEWRNDPAARAASFHRDPIPWERHLSWLECMLAKPQVHRAWIAEDHSGRPVGIVRCSREACTTELSLNLAPAARGRGWGTKLIRLGAFLAADEGFGPEIRARVKPSNAPSLAAFRQAGFRAISSVGAQVVEFSWEPNAALAAPPIG